MNKPMRVMTKQPLNAETPIESLRSWITANEVFFKRNQGKFPDTPINLADWNLLIDGMVENDTVLGFEDILRSPKVEIAGTLECSGNSRSLLTEKAQGNPWTVGGVGNAIWGGVWLRDLLVPAGLKPQAGHVSFEGFDKSMGKAGIKFIRSIPLEKALTTTLLAYEMNGAALPLKHGYPLRALALGWTGANSVKWLNHISVLEKPHEGFFMDKVYRVFQKGDDPKSGEVVTGIHVKSIIVEPTQGQALPVGIVPIRGAAYAGEISIAKVEVSLDEGVSWKSARLIGPEHPYAWRHWEYLWEARAPGKFTLMSRATDANGQSQPGTADWNVLGYGNNGIREHAVTIHITR